MIKLGTLVHTAVHAGGGAMTALWTFPSVLFSAFLIAWGAEAAQFVISQGMALAILAWLQTLPEFAVEAAISWGAATGAHHPDDPSIVLTTHHITQNFTGSIRLLVGVGMPLVFFVRYLFAKDRSKDVELAGEHSVEIVGLLLPMLYFVVIILKGTLTLFDSAVLTAMYAAYLVVLNKLPPEDLEEAGDLPHVSRKILGMPGRWKYAGIGATFLLGGLILLFTAHPFVMSVMALAPVIGVTTALAIQYIAPFLSEFPEKVSVFNWARQGGKKAPMAVLNIMSSNINQWTVLVAMIPIVYCFGKGAVVSIPFDPDQRHEILITLAQSVLCFLMLSDLKFSWLDAFGLFGLFVIQFFFPSMRLYVTGLYGLWILFELVLYSIGYKKFVVIEEFLDMWRTYVMKKPESGSQNPE